MAAAENRFSFTQDRLSKLVCPPSGRDERDGKAWFYDAKVEGLAYMTTEGGAGAFYVYRRCEGKPCKKRLGTLEDLNIEQARRRASWFNTEIASGRNPFKEAKEKRDATLKLATIDQLWKSYKDHWLAERKPKTIAEYNRLYDAHIEPAWRDRAINSIELADVEKLKTTIGSTTGHITANRVLEIVSAMFRRRGHAFGLARGFSPTAGVDTYPEKSRDRVLSTEELAKVMSSIDQEESSTARDYFKMLIFTGQRRNSVARMNWQDLNMEGATWKIPGEKTKNGKPLVVTLIPDAIEILKRRDKSNPADSPYVFNSRNFTPAQVEKVREMRTAGKPTREIALETEISQTAVMHMLSTTYVQRDATAFSGATKAWARITKRAKIAHATIHDIRRSFCTSMIERGVPLPIVAAAMGHRSMGTTQRHYAFASDKAVADATRTSMAGLLSDVKDSQDKAKRSKTA